MNGISHGRRPPGDAPPPPRTDRRAFARTAALVVAGAAVGGALPSCAFCRRLFPFRGGEPEPPGSAGGGAPVRVAVLGGSTVYGKGVGNPEIDALVPRLAATLGPGFLVVRFARTDAAVQRSASRSVWEFGLPEQVAAFSPDIVVVLLGRADAKPRHWSSRSRFMEDFDALLDQLAGSPSRPERIVCTPPPVTGPAPTVALDPKLLDDGVAPAIRTSARRARTDLVDLHHDLAGRDDLFDDGIHPNARGTAVIARTLAPEIERAAARRSR